MNLFLYQLKQAFLSLKQKPGFVFSVVSTMGITLGALLCVLTLNYLLLVKPLPYPEQDRLFVADHQIINAKQETQTIAFSYPGLEHLYNSKVAFEQAAMLYYDQGVITSHHNQPMVNITYATPELHQLLASPLALGRMFEASESLNTNNPVAMLSYYTWQKEFGGVANILEKTVNIRGISYRIVGILAENFVEPTLAEIGRSTQVWLPWDFNPESEEQRKIFGNIKPNFKFIGKLANGVSKNQAQQSVSPLVSNRWQEEFAAKYDFFKGWSVNINVRAIEGVILGDSESVAVMLLAGVVGLILIACTNISNLFISRTVEKQRLMAIQATIGATRKHIFKAVLAETSLLMLMSIVLALVIAQFGFYIMQQYLGAVLPRVSELSLNFMTFSVAGLVTLVFALFFANLSTGMINYNALNTILLSSGKGSGLQVSKNTRQILIASQVALATVLIFANLSLFKDAVKTINVPIGFTTDNISTIALNLSSSDIPSQIEAENTMAEFMAKLEVMPQVESLVQGSSPLDGFGIKALTKYAESEKYIPYFKRVDQSYFTMIKQPILQGENFTKADRRDNNNVMIVNQTFAKQLKDDGDVIGMQLTSIGEPNFKIIGIVQDITLPGQTAFGSEDIAATVPRSYAPNGFNEQRFMVKIKPEQSLTRQQLAELLAEVDSRFAVLQFDATSTKLSKSLFSEITTAIATASVALISFFLAGLGLYGVLSYSTQMRRFELGTHMAVGAKGHDLILMIIKDSAKPIVLGGMLSLIILFGLYFTFSVDLSSYMNVQLVPMFVATILLISTLSLFACYLPLRQYIKNPVTHALKGSE